MVQRMHYTDQQLAMMSVRDLINDFRATHKHFASGEMVKYHDTAAMVKLCEYAYECKQRAIAIFKNRHGTRVGKFGQVILQNDKKVPEFDYVATPEHG